MLGSPGGGLCPGRPGLAASSEHPQRRADQRLVRFRVGDRTIPAPYSAMLLWRRFPVVPLVGPWRSSGTLAPHSRMSGRAGCAQGLPGIAPGLFEQEGDCCRACLDVASNSAVGCRWCPDEQVARRPRMPRCLGGRRCRPTSPGWDHGFSAEGGDALHPGSIAPTIPGSGLASAWYAA